jgi:ABC-2 type transport system permease protein
MSNATTTLSPVPTVSAAVPSRTGTTAHGSRSGLPNVAGLLAGQVVYQARLMLSSGRALAVGIGLPIILMVATKGTGHPNVAGYAVFGLTITAWNSYGLRLVAARESGILRRWQSTPLPRWCYFVAAIVATAFTAVLAGAATVATAFLLWGPHFGGPTKDHLSEAGALGLLVACALGSLAYAAAVTAFTRLIPTVEAAFPMLVLTYFPVVLISGVLFTNLAEPHWLSTLTTYLPAQPLVDAVTLSVRHVAGMPVIPTHDVVVLACWAVGGLAAAVLTFRWGPHRPAQRRAARSAR